MILYLNGISALLKKTFYFNICCIYLTASHILSEYVLNHPALFYKRITRERKCTTSPEKCVTVPFHKDQVGASKNIELECPPFMKVLFLGGGGKCPKVFITVYSK